MSLVLGIDIGTSGIRTAIIDSEDRLVSMARADHLPQDPSGIDAELWWEAVQTCINAQVVQLQEEHHDPQEIVAIAVDGTSGTMVLTDAQLLPVSHALMYNSSGFDTEAARIGDVAPDRHVTRGSNSALARAMRLVSETGEDAIYLLHQADFVTAKLIGQGGLSDHNNTLKTGFDPETDQWPDWIDQVIPPNLLPRPQPVGTPLGHIRSDIAKELGLSSHVMVHAGTTDSIAAFLAASPLAAGHAVTSLGSTLAIKLVSEKRIDDPDIGLYSHRIGKFWLVGGASNTGGAVLAHFFSVQDIEELSTQIDPRVDTGLDYYPLLQPGERFPVNDPDFMPRITPRPERDVLFLQGLFEGIASIELRCYQAMAQRGADLPTSVRTAGGASKNEKFNAIRERTLGVQLNSARYVEAAVGAALSTRLARVL